MADYPESPGFRWVDPALKNALLLSKDDCVSCGYEIASLGNTFSDPLPMEENFSPALTGYRTWGRNMLSAGQLFVLDTFLLVHSCEQHDCTL